MHWHSSACGWASWSSSLMDMHKGSGKKGISILIPQAIRPEGFLRSLADCSWLMGGKSSRQSKLNPNQEMWFLVHLKTSSPDSEILFSHSTLQHCYICHILNEDLYIYSFYIFCGNDLICRVECLNVCLWEGHTVEWMTGSKATLFSDPTLWITRKRKICDIWIVSTLSWRGKEQLSLLSFPQKKGKKKSQTPSAWVSHWPFKESHTVS